LARALGRLGEADLAAGVPALLAGVLEGAFSLSLMTAG
jgi:hypothetical protein